MKCEECTVCCTTCRVKELAKAAGDKCSHCSTKCDIYHDRPRECRTFQCAYSQMTDVSVLMRPDNLGVVFERLDTDLMFGSIHHSDNTKHIQGQVSAFLKEAINVVLSKDGIPTVYHLDNTSPELILKRIHLIAEGNK